MHWLLVHRSPWELRRTPASRPSQQPTSAPPSGQLLLTSLCAARMSSQPTSVISGQRATAQPTAGWRVNDTWPMPQFIPSHPALICEHTTMFKGIQWRPSHGILSVLLAVHRLFVFTFFVYVYDFRLRLCFSFSLFTPEFLTWIDALFQAAC